jgi:hypothetical protein
MAYLGNFFIRDEHSSSPRPRHLILQQLILFDVYPLHDSAYADFFLQQFMDAAVDDTDAFIGRVCHS